MAEPRAAADATFTVEAARRYTEERNLDRPAIANEDVTGTGAGRSIRVYTGRKSLGFRAVADPKLAVGSMVHVHVADHLEPGLMRRRRRGADHAQAAVSAGKDPHDTSRALDFLASRSSILVDFMCLWCARGSR